MLLNIKVIYQTLTPLNGKNWPYWYYLKEEETFNMQLGIYPFLLDILLDIYPYLNIGNIKYKIFEKITKATVVESMSGTLRNVIELQ